LVEVCNVSLLSRDDDCLVLLYSVVWAKGEKRGGEDKTAISSPIEVDGVVLFWCGG